METYTQNPYQKLKFNLVDPVYHSNSLKTVNQTGKPYGTSDPDQEKHTVIIVVFFFFFLETRNLLEEKKLYITCTFIRCPRSATVDAFFW